MACFLDELIEPVASKKLVPSVCPMIYNTFPLVSSCSMFLSLVSAGVVSDEVTKPQGGDDLPPKEHVILRRLVN